ncbi:hypothetical protein [Clostridium rectalis]|uniref:hypothetical protein n=1 Tax=Clostridium rectalis TaxID=2040295 RepID=UPI000F640CE6|nr:hypothetical protein [Clostridium rectalis]
MEKYIVCGKNKIPTDKEYKIGDRFMTKNLTPIKCTKIEEINNEILYHFITNDENFNIDEALNMPEDPAIDKLLDFLQENYKNQLNNK